MAEANKLPPRKPVPGDRPCQKCNIPLTFCRNMDSEKGSDVPLDTRSGVYVVFTVNGKRKCVNIRAMLAPGRLGAKLVLDGKELDVEGVFVTHFATCPKARDFSRAD